MDDELEGRVALKNSTYKITVVGIERRARIYMGRERRKEGELDSLCFYAIKAASAKNPLLKMDL